VAPEGRGTTVRALRLDDGSTVWRRVLRDDVPTVSATGDGRLFLTRSRCATPGGCIGGDWDRRRGSLLALDAGTGRTIWTLPGIAGSAGPLWEAGALANGLLYVAGVRRWESFSVSRLAAIAAGTGRIRWTADVRGTFASVAAVADGRLFAITQAGRGGGRILAFGLPGATTEVPARSPRRKPPLPPSDLPPAA
jgi:outer membrane protein assembly factor BamB